MTQPSAYTGRPGAPAPGSPAGPEKRIARMRAHARRLFWSALALVALAGAVGYFTGNPPAAASDVLPPWMSWNLTIWVVAGILFVLLVLVPYVRWLSRTYTITTRRVIAQSGFFGRTRVEIAHARGYTVRERRGPVQRIWGAGTLTLANGVDEPVRLVDVSAVRLVHETLADQVEVSQILAHRDSHGIPVVPDRPGPPPPLP